MKAKQELSSEELFCLEGCSKYPQYYEMRKRFENKECPFCTIDEKVNLVIMENDHWRLMENAFPNTRACEEMLLITATQHLRMLSEITEKGWVALHEVIRFAQTMFHLPGGMLFIRFGDMSYNAGTVPHLHFNLWVPNKKDEVRIPLYKNPEDRSKNILRAEEFGKMYERGVTP